MPPRDSRTWARLVAGAAAAVCVLSACESRRDQAKSGNQQPDSLLSLWSPPTPQVAAAWAVDPYDADKRFRGMLLLANAPFGGERVYIEMYARATKDGDPSVQAAAVRGLALHGNPEHVPLIVAQVGSADRLLRWECARAMQRLHNPEAAGPLLRLIDERNEPESIVRSAAATALGQYAEARVLDGLISALGDRDLTVNRAAQDSLHVLTSADFGLDIRAWVAWKGRTPDPFADWRPFVYPVFYRDRTWVEWFVPFWRPPNEIAASPVGMEGPGMRAAGGSPDGAAGSVRKN